MHDVILVRFAGSACTALTAALLLTAAQPAAAQPGWVLSHQKISDTEGGFTGILDTFDSFGRSVASLGDLDGDGVGGGFQLVEFLFARTESLLRHL